MKEISKLSGCEYACEMQRISNEFKDSIAVASKVSEITEKYPINSKLPSIMEMANLMDVSPNTIRKAFNNLAKEGLLYFLRGRYGGTYVKNVPQSQENQPFEWVAVNPKYADYD